MRLRDRCRVRTLAFIAVGLLVAGCSATVTGSGKRFIPAMSSNATLQVVGDADTDFDRLAKNAIADVTAFWSMQYPLVSAGQPLPPLKGKIYSVDDAAPTAAVRQNACLVAVGVKAIKNNAFFCSLDDSIAYDRVGFIPNLAKKFGTYFVAAVFAHEFGHAVQYRLGTIRRYPSIVKETQADCAAGAFTAAALQDKAPHTRVTPNDLDTVLTGYIQLRDPTSHSANDRGSHGSGFDRLSAFSDGITNGAAFCYNENWLHRPLTERDFTSDQDRDAGGNQPLDKVLDPATPQAGNLGGGGLQPSLNTFWKKAAQSIGKSWQDVTIAEAAHPKCGAQSAKSEFGYCPDDNTVYYSRSIAERAYGFGDYALGTLFTYGWGMAVRHQLFGRSQDDQPALLAASCYSGSYTAAVNDPQATGFALSPPDMDEASTAVMTLVSTDQAFGGRGTNGLQRINSFTKGYFTGLSAC